MLEAVYIKLHSPACFVPTKGICERIVFGVNILRLCLTCLTFLMFPPFCNSYFVSRSGFLTGCIGVFLRHYLPTYLSVAALFIHYFLCNSPDESRTKNLLCPKSMTKLV